MKKDIYSDYILAVYFRPDRYYYLPSEEKQVMEQTAREIAEKIGIHVRPYHDITGMHFEYKTTHECSFCHNTWEVDRNRMPLCCVEAMKEFLDSMTEHERSQWCTKCFYIKSECECEADT